jgi:hypothetical protein
MILENKKRPLGITALSVFFIAGSVICLIASLSLLLPNSFIEPMWCLNPRAHAGFAAMGGWSIILLTTVGLFCAAAAIGLWRGARYGYRIALVLIAINLAGDIINSLLGTEPRAIIGVPIALAILIYLASKRVRLFFRNGEAN